MGASAAVAVIVIKEKHIVAAFRHAGATSPEKADTPAAIGVDERAAFHILIRRAVLREAEPGRYYLDEMSWEALRGTRRRRMMLLGVVLLIAVLWALLRTKG
jgi:hypothetical protein